MNQPATKYRYLVGLSSLDIQDSLGKGDQILDDFRITNDKVFIREFLKKDLVAALGGLETMALQNADALIYHDGTRNGCVATAPALEELSGLLELTGVFTTALWMVKDNAVNFELGFLEVWPPDDVYRAYSNFLAMTVTKADGSKDKAIFSRNELKEARAIYPGLLEVMSMGKPHEITSSSLLRSGQNPIMTAHANVPRYRRALYFLESARSFRDMGMKIAMYCSLFESLFSTDASEITHKIAHRIAVFLDQDPAKRCELYSRIKKAYSIRSKVVHGDEVKADAKTIQTIATDVDDISRQILRKIAVSKELFDKFHTGKSDLDDYFLKESFGKTGAVSIVEPLPKS